MQISFDQIVVYINVKPTHGNVVRSKRYSSYSKPPNKLQAVVHIQSPSPRIKHDLTAQTRLESTARRHSRPRRDHCFNSSPWSQHYFNNSVNGHAKQSTQVTHFPRNPLPPSPPSPLQNRRTVVPITHAHTQLQLNHEARLQPIRSSFNIREVRPLTHILSASQLLCAMAASAGAIGARSGPRTSCRRDQATNLSYTRKKAKSRIYINSSTIHAPHMVPFKW